VDDAIILDPMGGEKGKLAAGTRDKKARRDEKRNQATIASHVEMRELGG
jgi:hypothetical protein